MVRPAPSSSIVPNDFLILLAVLEQVKDGWEFVIDPNVSKILDILNHAHDHYSLIMSIWHSSF